MLSKIYSAEFFPAKFFPPKLAIVVQNFTAEVFLPKSFPTEFLLNNVSNKNIIFRNKKF